MSKMWKVFLYEYKRHVFRKRFIFVLLSMPLFLLFVVGAGVLSVVLQTNNNPVGYVDQSGFLANPVLPDDAGGSPFAPVELIAFSDETTARAALDSGDIQAYYVLAPDYMDTSNARMVALDQPDSSVQNDFAEFIQINLLASQPPEIAQRFTDGPVLEMQSADGSRQMGESDWFNFVMPLLGGILVMIVIMTSGGYLLQAVVEEKENRTMEMVITSVSPDQLMAGKTLGNLSVGLTQLMVWIGFAVIALLVARGQFDWAARLQIGWDYLLLMAGVLLPTFVMVSGLMAAIGASVTEVREAQQISGLFTLPIMCPFWFTSLIMSNPNGALATGLSFFPLTAPVTLMLRAGFTQVPAWQITLNVVVLVLCAIGAIWLAARTFRLGMLSYGKRLSWKQVIRSQQ